MGFKKHERFVYPLILTGEVISTLKENTRDLFPRIFDFKFTRINMLDTYHWNSKHTMTGDDLEPVDGLVPLR